MNDMQMKKMERYFLNAPFLWGLPPSTALTGLRRPSTEKRRRLNQPETYIWLEGIAKREGFQFKASRSPYRSVQRHLLEDPGIEKILEGVIIPTIKDMFTPDQLDFLRDCWMAGTRPDMALLNHHNIDDPHPFLAVNQQFEFVEWGQFAGLWFEEIEGMHAEGQE